MALRTVDHTGIADSASAADRGLAAWLFGSPQRHENPFQRVLATASHPIGSVLLAAQTHDEFECLLVSLLDDERAASAFRLIVEASDTLDPQLDLADVKKLKPEVAQYLGTTAASIVLKSFPMVDALTAAHQQLAHLAGRPGLSPRTWPQTLGAALDPGELPAVVYQLLADGILGRLAFISLAHAVLHKVRLADWLGVLCAARYRDGLHALLRFASSTPGVTVREQLIPKHERLDLPQIWREFEEASLALHMIQLDHQASGRSHSYPFSVAGDAAQG